MNFPIEERDVRTLFPLLTEIPDAPEKVYTRGTMPTLEMKCLAVVGSRNYTNYGKQVVEHLISGLRGYPIAIISGLALGIDALAHKAALEANLFTLAVPGSGIDDRVIYPRQHRPLAREILENGGGLLSEFDPLFTATQWSFPQRNRIMAGLSHATLLIEAGEKSGTLITARLAVDYNRELLVVPGNIFSGNSIGTHQFLKLGATPVTTPEDILSALNIKEKDPSAQPAILLSENEMAILALLAQPMESDALIRLLSNPPHETLTLLMHMELSGYIREQNGVFFKLM